MSRFPLVAATSLLAACTPAERQWRSLDVGASLACAIDADGTTHCWGNTAGSTAEPRPGPYNQLTLSSTGYTLCGLLESARADCWGITTHGEDEVPSGRFQAISSESGVVCAVEDGGGELTCWGENSLLDPGPAPEGDFLGLSMAGTYGCAIRSTDENPVCWGRDDWPTLDGVPDLPLAGVQTAAEVACGIGPTGETTCWGNPTFLEPMSVPDRVSRLALHGTWACAILPDGTPVCPDERDWSPVAEVPIDTARLIAVGADAACAVTFDEQLVCWGDPDSEVLAVPADLRP